MPPTQPAAAKRVAEPKEDYPWKSRRRVLEFRGPTSPKRLAGEFLELTNTLESRLRFVGADPGNFGPEEELVELEADLQVLSLASPKRQICTTEDDGWQLVEEASLDADSNTSSPPPESAGDPCETIAPAEQSPVCYRQDTTDYFQWRVINLPYPASNYHISIDSAKQQIVIQTSNRKYYKRINLPELSDELNEQRLSWRHEQTSILVSYARMVPGAPMQLLML